MPSDSISLMELAITGDGGYYEAFVCMQFVKKSEMIFFTGIKVEKYQKKAWKFTEKNERDFIFNFSH